MNEHKMVSKPSLLTNLEAGCCCCLRTNVGSTGNLSSYTNIKTLSKVNKMANTELLLS